MNFLEYLLKALKSGFTYFVVFVIFLVFTAKNFKENKMDASAADTAGVADSLIAFANQLKGVDYRFGGLDESGFDCSGFTYFVFNKFDIRIPRSSRDQFNAGVKLTPDEIRKGDLVFFKGRNLQSDEIGHVGIAVSDWGEKKLAFIHASRSQGIRIDSITHFYYWPRFIGAARIL